jgi:hypothetical protein
MASRTLELQATVSSRTFGVHEAWKSGAGARFFGGFLGGTMPASDVEVPAAETTAVARLTSTSAAATDANRRARLTEA